MGVMKFYEINDFHERIYGHNPTDPRFEASSRKRDLYRAYVKNGAKGFSGRNFIDFPLRDDDDELFIATMTLALRQVQLKGEKVSHPVLLAVPKALDAWAFSLSKVIYKLVLQQFRGDVSVAKTMRQAFGQIYWDHRITSLTEEPDRWVAYGFDPDFPIPKWMEGRLIVPRNK